MKRRRRRRLPLDDTQIEPKASLRVKKSVFDAVVLRQKSLELALNDTSFALAYVIRTMEVEDLFRKRVMEALDASTNLIGPPKRPIMRKRL